MKHIFWTADERSNRRKILAVTTQLEQLRKESLKKKIPYTPSPCIVEGSALDLGLRKRNKVTITVWTRAVSIDRSFAVFEREKGCLEKFHVGSKLRIFFYTRNALGWKVVHNTVSLYPPQPNKTLDLGSRK